MNNYFTNTPASINCKEDELEEIKNLLKVIPKELLTNETIAAIENGEPIRLFTEPTTKAFRYAQDPQVQKCYEKNILQYIVTAEYADALTSGENSRRWKKRYESRCTIKGKPCSPHNSCEKCPHKDQKQPFISQTSYDEYQQEQKDRENSYRTPSGVRRPIAFSDPTADAAIELVKHEALLEFLIEEDETYAKEHLLKKRGYKSKQIAAQLGLSEVTVCRDLKKVKALEDEFEAEWNAD